MLVTCPNCKKETAWEENPFRPFCSERCRLIDLGKWASDEYRISSDKKGHPERRRNEKNSADK